MGGIEIDKKQERTFVAEDIKAIIEGTKQILDIYEKIVHDILMTKFEIKPIEFDRKSAEEAFKLMKDDID